MAPRTLLILAALLLSPVARADKFWLESPDSKHSAEGSSPAMIEGHMLGQDDTHYHLRVVGGELWLQKSLVVKVEQGGMDQAAIEQQERDLAEDLAAQTEQRIAAQADAHRVATVDQVHIDEIIEVEAHDHYGPAAGFGFDPVVGVHHGGHGGHYERMFELKELYDMTDDRRYIKWLRRMRRLH